MHGWLRLEAALGGMLCITLLALWSEEKLLRVSEVLEPSGYSAVMYDDRSSGGKSVGTLVTQTDAWEWQCQLRQRHEFPHCGFELLLGRDRLQGIDMTSAEKLRLWLHYEGDSPSVRVYLRNYNPAYSTPSRQDSTKYNQVEVAAALVDGLVEVDIKDFFVSNWWTSMNHIPPALSHPEFSNIVVLEVTTSMNPVFGDHDFRMEKIELVGRRLSTVQWYRLLFGSWLAAAFVFLVVRLLRLKREVAARRRREQELISLTKLLDERGKELESRVGLDPLTGAFNREGVKDALESGLSASRNQGMPMSVILIDVDHFKRINDTHGHPIGDQVLVELSELVKQNTRAPDAFARWGGEEFVLVCQNTTLQEGALLAEKIRGLVAAHSFKHGVSVTLSLGVARLQPKETLDRFFARLDKALYAAKAQGRNRVIIAAEAAA